MLKISLLLGLLLIDNGFCQLFQNPEIANEEDLVASPATLFGPKTFGLRSGHLGGFGPLGYGNFGGIRLGSIGPFHYGHIGGIHADSFLGASNPNAKEGESPGSSGTHSGNSQYQEFVGNPMEANSQNFDSNANIVGMEPNQQEMWGYANNDPQQFDSFNQLGLEPQMPENSRAFLNEGLFGVKKDEKGDKFEKIPPKPAPPPKFPKPPKFTPPAPPPPPPPPTYNYYGHNTHHGHHDNGYGNHGYGNHGYGSHGHGSSHTPSYRYGHGTHHGMFGHGGLHGLHDHGFSSHGHSGGHFHKMQFTSFSSKGGHFNKGFGHHGFRSNDELDETMTPYNANDQFQDANQIISQPVLTASVHHIQPNYNINEIPQSRSSARPVDGLLDGIQDLGIDIELRDMIENIFLLPYLGLLDQ